MTKFVIVRHGQSVANLEERYAGCYNALLTPLGKKQAELLTEYILKTYRVDAVYSSPLSRAIETVEKIASRSGVVLNVCEGLREIDGGKWEGLSLREIAENYPQDAYLWKTDIGRARPTGGESFAQVQARADKALRKIAEESADKTVVIGTHGGVIRSMQCLFNGVPITEMKNIPWTPNASVSEINYENGAYTPVSMGYTGFLSNDQITRLAEL